MIAPHVFLLHAIVELHWGFIARQHGATATQTAYVLPPPTTVVGAFTAPLGRILGVPDYKHPRPRRPVLHPLMECALEATLAAGAGLAGGGLALVEEPSRLIGAPYKGGGALNRALKSPIVVAAGDLLPVQAVGAASGPGALLVLAWLVDASALARCARRSITRETLERAANAVYRLGSKEGAASIAPGGGAGVIGAEGLELVEAGSHYKSILYQPDTCATPLSPGDVARLVLPDETYTERAYLVPAGPGSGGSIVRAPGEPAVFRLNHGPCKVVQPRGGDPPLALATVKEVPRA